jgi:hypothetical protein
MMEDCLPVGRQGIMEGWKIEEWNVLKDCKTDMIE